MPRRVALLCLLISSVVYPGMQDGTFCIDSSELIFDDAFVRLEPTDYGKPIGYLTAGAVLDVRDYTDIACSLNGYVSEWFEVEWYDEEWLPGQAVRSLRITQVSALWIRKGLAVY